MVRSAAHDAMLPHVPFASAEDLQSGGVDHDVPRLNRGPGAELTLKVALPLAHGGVVWDGKVNIHQPHQRLQESQRGAQAQVEYRLDEQGALDCGVGVELRAPAGPEEPGCASGAHRLLVNPEGNAAAAHESAVVFSPVADAVPENEVRVTHGLSLIRAPSALFTDNQQRPANREFCATHRFCKQTASCQEARLALTACGYGKLDKDGIPCETLCN